MTVKLTPGEMRTNAERIYDEQVKERVLRGIEILTDKLGPDWVDHIDLASGSRCVLGQVFADAPFDLGAVQKYARPFGYPDDDPEEVWLEWTGYDRGRAVLNAGVAADARLYGFDTLDESYDELTEAWEMVFGVPPVTPT